MVRAQELVLLFLSFTSLSHQSSQGFHLPITHRDSPRSPFYNPNATISDRWKSAYKRSIARHNYVESVLNPSYSLAAEEVGNDEISGEYFTQLLIGTPPQDTNLVVDTGGGLVWTQCLPCAKCHPQIGPLFDPSKSSSYSKYSCFSVACEDLIQKECLPDDTCRYKDTYANSTTSGILSSDTFVMETSKGAIPYPDMAFGCGDNNTGSYTAEETGRLGLSGGPLSLISQLGIQRGWRFSHCFEAHRTRGVGESHLYIGNEAVLFGNSTPISISLVTGQGAFYFVTLNDISVGPERLNIPPGAFTRRNDGSGGVIVDSASPLMFLNANAFYKLVWKLSEEIKLEPVGGSEEKPPLCYKGTKEDLVEGGKVPTVTLHFKNLDVPLRPLNMFAEMSEKLVCLVVKATFGASVIGNYAQQNMNVGFDLDKQELTMAPAICATF